MANSDKNILITPNIGQSSDPKIDFVGFGNSTLTMRVDDDSFGTIVIESNTKKLFSINSDLSNYTFKIKNSFEISPTGITTIGSGFSKVKINSGRGIQIPQKTTLTNAPAKEGVLIFDKELKIANFSSGGEWVDMSDSYKNLPKTILTSSDAQGENRQNTLWAWHDGSDPNGNGLIPLTKTNVTRWMDKSNNHLHLINRVGSSPSDIVFHPGVCGRGAVYYTGGSYITSAVTAPFGNLNGVTWFMVYKSSISDSGARSLATLTPTNPYYVNWYNQDSGRSLRWEAGDSPRANTTFDQVPDTWYVAVGRLSTTYGFTFRVSNGYNLVRTDLSNTITNSSRGVNLGQYSGSFHNNYIGESIIYNSYLGNKQVDIIFNYLLKKWKVSGQ